LQINLINLDRSTDRLREFLSVNRHLREIARWSAVDGSTLDIPALVQRGVIAPEVSNAYSKGSLGNAFSHIGLWERASQTGQPLTIAEDDGIFHHDFEAHAATVLPRLPATCDLILWGWNFDAALLFGMLPGVSPCLASFDQSAMRAGVANYQSQPLSPQPFRLLMGFGLMCYTIFPAGARTLKRLCVPLRGEKFFLPSLKREVTNYGIDVLMASVYPQINAFVCFPPIAISKNERATSLTITPASGRKLDE
jgi:glycosyl transferase, family 25